MGTFCFFRGKAECPHFFVNRSPARGRPLGAQRNAKRLLDSEVELRAGLGGDSLPLADQLVA